MARNPNHRIIATIGMMGSTSNGGDGEAQNAFRLATRLLEARGMTWRDIAERAFGDGPSAPFGFGAGFDDIFRQAGGYGSPPPRSGPARPTRDQAKKNVSGMDVPHEIGGTVRIIDATRRSRNGPMLILEIVGVTAVYGPLVCFDEDLLDDLKDTGKTGGHVMVRIRPPREAGQRPVVTHLSR